MITLIKDWIKTATYEEILELQHIMRNQSEPQTVIVKKVIEFINNGHYLEAIKWVKEIKGITTKEAHEIVDKIKNIY